VCVCVCVCMYVCINESYDCCIQILWLMSRIGVECKGDSGHVVMRLSNCCDTAFRLCVCVCVCN
jgi:hypothetical protein